MKRRSFIKGVLGIGAGLAATKASSIEKFPYAESSIRVDISDENLRQLRDAKLLRSHVDKHSFLTTRNPMYKKHLEQNAKEKYVLNFKEERHVIYSDSFENAANQMLRNINTSV